MDESQSNNDTRNELVTNKEQPQAEEKVEELFSIEEQN